MRSYTKLSPPVEINAWQPSSDTWKDFSDNKAAYVPVKTSLITEQTHLCCYCEFSLAEGDLHIEHFQPKSGCHGDRARTFEYANLACSCNGGSDKNRHCGMYKGSKYNSNDFINPTAESSERFFTYTVDGGICASSELNASEQKRATYMIELLNLNCPRLISKRRAHARGITNAIEGLIKVENLDQFDYLVCFYLTCSNDKSNPFFSLSKQILSP